MHVIRCKNAHFFDGDTYKTCPLCGEPPMENDSTVEKSEKKGFWGLGRKNKSDEAQYETQNGIGSDSASKSKEGKTLDFWQTSSQDTMNESVDVKKEMYERDANIPNNGAINDILREPMQEPVKEPVQEPARNNIQQKQEEHDKKESPVESDSTNERSMSLRDAIKTASASNEGKTMSYFSSANAASTAQKTERSSAEPVVGWLVCVGGYHFGECFNIYAGKNSIGRSEENSIVVSGDNGVSRVKHALIVYEPKKRDFYLQPGDSSGLTYLNEDYIMESRKLAIHDMIELGESKFIFVPLCGEAFSWEKYIQK